ncbi:MAG: vWA domain-containing protein, partial [Myxococcota bacterium]
MLLSLLLALSGPDAAAAENGLAAVWRTPTPAATWIIVLESNSALKGAAEAAREPIARFVEALPAGDRVEILAVHARATPALPVRTVDDAGHAALVDEIRKLQIPAAKSTDLGAALTALGASIQAAPDGPRFVLFAGSFCHSPPLGSV